jgi:hypothetical protein
MTTTPDELLQDAYEEKHGYDQEVTCDNCPEVAVVRFWEGEAVYASDLDCDCGGRFRVE